MLSFWIKDLTSKDSTNLLCLKIVGVIGCSHWLVSIGISSVDVPEGILKGTFLNRSILGRLMIANPLYVKRMLQKQSSRGVLRKKCLENMLQIYRRTISKQIFWITLWHRFSPVNLLHIFRTPFPKNTSGRLLLTWSLFVALFCLGVSCFLKYLSFLSFQHIVY